MFVYSIESFQITKMAKGKHAPNPGAIKDKVLHPNSRKLKKVHKQSMQRYLYQLRVRPV